MYTLIQIGLQNFQKIEKMAQDIVFLKLCLLAWPAAGLQ